MYSIKRKIQTTKDSKALKAKKSELGQVYNVRTGKTLTGWLTIAQCKKFIDMKKREDKGQ